MPGVRLVELRGDGDQARLRFARGLTVTGTASDGERISDALVAALADAPAERLGAEVDGHPLEPAALTGVALDRIVLRAADLQQVIDALRAARREELTSELSAVEADLAASAELATADTGDDTSTGTDEPDPIAAGLADDWEHVTARLAEIGEPGLFAIDDLHAVERRIAQAEAASRSVSARPRIAPDKSRQLRALHEELEAAQRTVERRGSRRAMKKLQEAEAAERALLDEVGIASYLDFVLGVATSSTPDELSPEQVGAELEDARATRERLLGAKQQAEESRALREHADHVRSEARRLIGRDPGEDVAGALRAWRPVDGDTAPGPNELERLEQSRTELEAGIAALDGDLDDASVDEVLKRALAEHPWPENLGPLPVVLDDALAAFPAARRAHALDILDDLSAEVQVIVCSDDPVVTEWEARRDPVDHLWTAREVAATEEVDASEPEAIATAADDAHRELAAAEAAELAEIGSHDTPDAATPTAPGSEASGAAHDFWAREAEFDAPWLAPEDDGEDPFGELAAYHEAVDFEVRREAALEENERREAQENARRQADEAARREAEENARREEGARREAEQAAAQLAAELERMRAEEAEHRLAEQLAREEVEEAGRRFAERAAHDAAEEARRAAEEDARRNAEEEAARVEEERRAAQEAARRETEEADARAEQERQLREAAEQARLEAEAAAQRATEEAEAARVEAEAAAQRAAEEAEAARVEAEAAAQRAAEEAEAARVEAEAEARRVAEEAEAARAEAEAEARRATEEAEAARREAEEAARLAAEEADAARREAERIRAEAEDEALIARLKAEAQAIIAAEDREKAAAAEHARLEAEEAAARADELREEAERDRRRREEAEEAAAIALETARRAEEQARRAEADLTSRRSDDEYLARLEAELEAARAALEESRREAREFARLEAEEIAARDAEELSRRAAVNRLRHTDDDVVHREAETAARRAAAAARRAEEAASRAEVAAVQEAEDARLLARLEHDVSQLRPRLAPDSYVPPPPGAPFGPVVEPTRLYAAGGADAEYAARRAEEAAARAEEAANRAAQVIPSEALEFVHRTRDDAIAARRQADYLATRAAEARSAVPPLDPAAIQEAEEAAHRAEVAAARAEQAAARAEFAAVDDRAMPATGPWASYDPVAAVERAEEAAARAEEAASRAEHAMHNEHGPIAVGARNDANAARYMAEELARRAADLRADPQTHDAVTIADAENAARRAETSATRAEDAAQRAEWLAMQEANRARAEAEIHARPEPPSEAVEASPEEAHADPDAGDLADEAVAEPPQEQLKGLAKRRASKARKQQAKQTAQLVNHAAKLSRRCQNHNLEDAVAVCGRCEGSFCRHCIVKVESRGENLCVACALQAAGVRSTPRRRR